MNQHFQHNTDLKYEPNCTLRPYGSIGMKCFIGRYPYELLTIVSSLYMTMNMQLYTNKTSLSFP